MRRSRLLLVCALLALLAPLTPTSIAAEEEAKPVVAVVGARLLPVSRAPIEDGLLLLEGDRIAYAGPRAGREIPDGATVVSAEGLTASPGLIDAQTSLYLSAEELRRPTVGADVRALDGVDPFDPEAAVVLRAGITTVFVGPGGAPGVNGRGAVLRLLPGRPPRELALPAEPTIAATLGGPRDPGPIARLGQEGRIVGLLRAAEGYRKAKEKYAKDREAYEKALAEYRKKKAAAEAKEKKEEKGEKREKKEKEDGGKGPPAPEKKAPAKAEPPKEPVAPVPPPSNPAMEALLPLLDRRGLLRVEASRAEDLLAALRVRDAYPVRLVLSGAAEAGRILPALVASRAAVVVGPVLADDDAAKLAVRLHERKVPFAIATFAAPGRASAHLPLHAAAAVRAGLPRDAALRAVTLSAAEVCGAAARIGSLDPGKDADVVLWSGHPLDSRSRVVRVILAGETVHEAKP